MRFDEMIRPGMTVREVRTRYPNTAELLIGFGFRESCDDCSLDVVCRKYGLSSRQVVEALNEAVFGPVSKSGPEKPVQ